MEHALCKRQATFGTYSVCFTAMIPELKDFNILNVCELLKKNEFVLT